MFKINWFQNVVAHRIPAVLSLAAAGLALLVVVSIGEPPMRLGFLDGIQSLRSHASAERFSASPNPIPVCDGSGFGVTTLTWNIADNVRVEVYKAGGAETLVTQGVGQGSVQVVGVAPQTRYDLYIIGTQYQWTYNRKARQWERVPVTRRSLAASVVVRHTADDCEAAVTPLSVSVAAAETVAGQPYTLIAQQDGQPYTGGVDVRHWYCRTSTDCAAPTVTAPWTGIMFDAAGKAVVSTATALSPGIYKGQIRPVGAAEVAWSNEFTVVVTRPATNLFRGVYTPPAGQRVVELFGDTQFANGLRAFASCVRWQGDAGTVEGLPTGLQLGDCVAYKQAPTGYTIRSLPDAGTNDANKYWNLNEGVHAGPLSLSGFTVPAGEDLQIHRMEVNPLVIESSQNRLWVQLMNNLGMSPQDPGYNSKLVRTYLSDRKGSVIMYANTKNELHNIATSYSSEFANHTWPTFLLEHAFKQLVDVSKFSELDFSADIEISGLHELPGWRGSENHAAPSMVALLRHKGNPFRGLWLVIPLYDTRGYAYSEVLGGDQWGIALYRASAASYGGPLSVGAPAQRVHLDVLKHLRRAIALGPDLGTVNDWYLAQASFNQESLGYHEIAMKISNPSMKGVLK